MSQPTTAIEATDTCDPATRVTKSLLGYGVIAGPCYVLVSLAQASTRDGFELSRHAWSVLANGDLGWLQVTNLILTGLMVTAAAMGLARALGRGSGLAPRLLAGYGLSMVAAGVFRADPVPGFPVGTPADVPISWHGTAHLASAAIGFGCLVAACFVLARRFTADGPQWLVRFSRITGVLFPIGFGSMAATGGATVTILGFTAVILLAWAWLSTVSIHHYRRAARA
jgi:hypothetical protein